jgi:ribosomal protein S1
MPEESMIPPAPERPRTDSQVDSTEASPADGPPIPVQHASLLETVTTTETSIEDAQNGMPVTGAPASASEAPAASAAGKASTAAGEPAPGETAASEAPALAESPAQGEPIPAAALSESAPPAAPSTPKEIKAGDRVRGRIVAIDEEETLVDLGGPAPARIPTAEIRDRDGHVLLRLDDKLSAAVAAIGERITLTLGRKRGVLQAARLRLALENRTPVEGTVRGMNKGGFEVNMGGVRAFCPLSHIESGFVQDPRDYLGKSYPFRVLRWEGNGRNIVVSRRSILREEAKQHAQEVRSRLTEGTELEGTVTHLQPFGAFVDLGGLEGLVHVSRMSHGRVDDPASVVHPGDKVRVRVVKVENPGTRRERIALALADLGPDPWEAVGTALHEGDVVSGTVLRCVPFGAFVRLQPGVEGLVHVSELSIERIADPKEAVSPGQEVQVRVLKIDAEKRRISLSVRRLEAEPAPRAPRPRRDSRRGRPQRREQVGAATPAGLTHTMAEQLGHLKDKLRSAQ